MGEKKEGNIGIGVSSLCLGRKGGRVSRDELELIVE